MSSLQDVTLLGHSVETGVDDFACALKVYESGSQEAKNLLLNETAPVFECKSCRALFRKIDAFVGHKQGGCQPTATSAYLSDRRSREVTNGVPKWQSMQGKRVRLEGNPDHDYNDVFKATMQHQLPNSAVNKTATCDARANSAKDRVITNGNNGTATRHTDQRHNGGTSAMQAREPAPSRWTVVVNRRRSAPASTVRRSGPDLTTHEKRCTEQGLHGRDTPRGNTEQAEMRNSPGAPALLTPPSETASLSSQSSWGSDSHRRSARQRMPSKRLQPYILDPLLSPPPEEPDAKTGKNPGEHFHHISVQRTGIVRGSTHLQSPFSIRVVTARQEVAQKADDTIKGGEQEAAETRMVASCGMRANAQTKAVPTDLAQVPVLMTSKQRDLLFSPLRALFTGGAKDGLHQCAECGTLAQSLQEGQRHVISHVRAIRMQCKLCNAGAFYCQDMRRHLMYRHCESLHLAPEGYVAEGTVVPCMDVKKADQLVRFADEDKPGRLAFTPGRIVSCMNPKAHFPDPRTEARILSAV